MAIPIELFIMAGAYLLLFVGIGFPQFTIIRMAGAIAVMVLGVYSLFPGITGIDNSNLISLTLGTVSIGLGFFFLIQDSFSFDRQVDHFNQDDDGRFHE